MLSSHTPLPELKLIEFYEHISGTNELNMPFASVIEFSPNFGAKGHDIFIFVDNTIVFFK